MVCDFTEQALRTTLRRVFVRCTDYPPGSLQRQACELATWDSEGFNPRYDEHKHITSDYNDPDRDHHYGIDYSVESGTDLNAPVTGEVIFAKEGTPGSGYNNYGNTIAIKDKNGNVHVMGHLSSITVKEGQKINFGDFIGQTGGKPGDPGSGNSTGPHLHYEIRINGEFHNTVDPKTYNYDQ